MNCEKYREQVLNALASGVDSPGGKVEQHLRTCAACGAFFTAQKNLFAAIDSGISAAVNVPAPPSLLPGVRAHVANLGPKRNWLPILVPASFALAAALFAVGLFVRDGNRIPVKPNAALPQLTSVQGPASIPSQTDGVRGPVAPPARMRPAAKLSRSPFVPTPAADSDVIVLPEESAAFAAFVSELSKQRAIAVAFTRPAARTQDATLEIALLVVEDLEVKPLAARAEDQDLN